MEDIYISQILEAAESYAAKRNIQLTTLGKICAKDARFFSRLKEGHTLTLRKYDEVMNFLLSNEVKRKQEE